MDVEGLRQFGEDLTTAWKRNLLRSRKYGEFVLCTGSAGVTGWWKLQSCSGEGMGAPTSAMSCTERTALLLPVPGLLPEVEQAAGTPLA